MRLLLVIGLLGSLAVSVRALAGETLVLLDTMSTKDTHSEYFKLLEGRGYKLTYKLADDSSLALKKFGEYIYKHIILFSPSTDEFGGSINTKTLTEFVDDGGNILAATNSKVGEAMRDLAAECGFEVDDESSSVIDHLNYNTISDKGDHTHVVVPNKNMIPVPVIVGDNAHTYNPILYKGVGLITERKNPLVVSVLHASTSAYSANPLKATAPHIMGQQTTLVAALQARNNARVTFSGSLLLFSNEFFKADVQATGTNSKTKSGNKDFADAISRWTFKETGVLRFSDIKHGGPYTVTDPATFSMKVEMLNDKGAWVAYDHPSIQIEFVRIDPFIRTQMKKKSADGTYEVTFKVPDVYGVYQFKIDHRRLGYTHLYVTSQVSVHPLQHTMYERFIPSARPYYISAFSMMLGVFVFSFVFIHHKDADKKKKE